MKLHLTENERIGLEYVKHIFSFVFQTLLILFLIALLIREFFPELVNSLVNINWFMLVVIVFGALSIIFPPKKQNEVDKSVNWKDIILIIALGILGGVIIFLKLRNLEWIGILISTLGGLIIILLSWMILTEKENN